ncbi:MAG: hypothetical protein KA247_03595 [Bacteroidetes bacterium]|nr:hypothetical protein [Bacteroidota bacterium]
MKKLTNICSVLMLIVYGTLTLVVVPLHHHTHVHSSTSHQTSGNENQDCGLCTISATVVVFQPALTSVTMLQSAERIHFTDHSSELSTAFSKEYPRRGPPSITA